MKAVPSLPVPMKSRVAAFRYLGRMPVLGALALVVAALYGCSVASAPISETPPVVATPIAGHLSISLQRAPAVGNVVPVYVSVANGTDIARTVFPNQVFALNYAGERVAPLPPGEAARQAGGAGELKAALASGAVSGAVGGAVGAGLGAAVGAVWGGVGSGAVIGSAIGAGEGILEGAGRGEAKADRQAHQQINALALRRQNVGRDFTVSGYVFFPNGSYQRIQLLLVNRETGDTELIERPWP